MKRTILFAVALVAVVVSGAVHGFWTGRWDADTLVVETQAFAANVTGLQPWANFSSGSGSGAAPAKK